MGSLHGYAQKTEPLVMISTDHGDIIVKLYNETPGHRDNFLKLIGEGHYEGTTFQRVIKDFMIQGGGRVSHTLPAEILPQYYHKKGALAAARRPDNVNPQKRSSGSQFYIVEGRVFSPKELQQMQKATGKEYTQQMIDDYTTWGGAPHLDREYTVFGEVVMGLQVVERISELKTDRRNTPYDAVKMKVKVVE
ncbi:MAG: peptidylprolyl isomerase [Bacteroidales bacterium]|nr:peptidylprolyl isomerase [Bacteroidales bacterium]